MTEQEIARLADCLIPKLAPGIEETIQKKVNGKIDRLSQDVQGIKDINEAHAEAMFNHNQKHEEHMGEINDKLKKLEENIAPLLDAYRSILWNTAFITKLSAVIISLGIIGGGILWIVRL